MPTREQWNTRVWREYRAGNLTRASRDVLITLQTFRSVGGLAWPSHETLAERAGCCARTVRRALAQAQRLGLVSWTERRIRAGWRWLRTSNAYRVQVPDEPVQPGMRPRAERRRATGGHSGRGGESEESKKVQLRQMLATAAVLPNLLAARRRVIEGRLLTGGVVGRS